MELNFSGRFFSTQTGVFLRFSMKMLAFLSCTIALALGPKSGLAQNVDILIKEDKTLTIKQAFRLINKQTDYTFIYRPALIKDAPKVKFNKGTIKAKDLLDTFLSPINFTFEFTDEETIVVKRIVRDLKVGVTPPKKNETMQFQVSGNVVDGQGVPLLGANVIEKGTTNGVTTDFDGNFSLQVADENAILLISYIGYTTKELPLNGASTVSIVLEESSSLLDEVVIVGYGTQKKANLTGAVTSLDTEQVRDLPVPNTLNRLQGQLAGVQLTLPGGQPGADQPIVRVRGATSIGGDENNTAKNNPLVIIDGIQGTLEDLARTNPNDIENISVLKDAASSAIYGARAANGVILVTTKTGTVGKPKISFGVNSGIQTAIVLPEFVGAADYAILKNESRTNRGEQPYFSEEEIQLLRDQTDPRVGNTYWMDELFGSAPITQYDMSVSGGTENVQYLFTGGWVDQEGIMLNQSADRFNFRSNLNANLSDRISLGMNVWGFRNIARRAFSNTRGTLGRAYFSQPLVPPRWTEGPAEGELAGWTDLGVGNPKGVQNPLLFAEAGSTVETNDRFNIQFNANVELAKNLTYTGVYGYSVNSNNVQRYRPVEFYRRFDGNIAPSGFPLSRSIRSLSQDNQYQIDNLINYNNTWGRHTLGVLAGHSVLNFENDFFSSQIEGLASNIEELDAGTINPLVQGRAFDWSLQSFFGRVNYSFNDRYLFEANFRADGSSRFADARRYGYFPSFSGAWRISEESFLRDSELISNLKLRASWGILGNQEIGNYPSTQVYDIGQFYVDANGNLVTGAAITDLANPNLQWEETTTTNFGLDFSLWNGKLDMTIDYFEKITDGILVRLPLPPTLGEVNPPFQNAAQVENRGWEFAGSFRESIGDFNFSISGNFNILQNEVTDFNDQESIFNRNIIKEGEQINAFFGFRNIGIFQTQEEVDNSPFQSDNTAPGDLIYGDINGDGVINQDDRTVIGNVIPTYSYGFNLDFAYKGIDLGLFFQGVGDVVAYSYGWGNDASSNPRANIITDWLNRWTPENPSTEYPRIVRGDRNNSQTNSYWLRDASFLRLRNIQLGYTFPETPAFEAIGLNSLRIYFSGQNLLTFTEATQWDPEIFPSETNSRQHPQTKVVSVGLNASF